jgi:hypothetical protein
LLPLLSEISHLLLEITDIYLLCNLIYFNSVTDFI